MRAGQSILGTVPGVRYRGLLVLVLWQAAPIGTYTDDAGRTRIGFGFGAAQFEAVSFDCEGRPADINRGRNRAGGVQLETIVRGEWRLNASVGFVDDSHAPLTYDPPVAFTGAALLAYEQQNFAVGAGVARLPRRVDPSFGEYGYDEGSGGAFLPALHVRIGPPRVHFRADMLEPSPTLGTLGEVRAGVGFGPGLLRRGVSGYGGMALCHVCMNDATGSSNTSVFMQLGVPVARAFDIDVGALFGPGREHASLGATVGGRIYLGPSAQARGTTPLDRGGGF